MARQNNWVGNDGSVFFKASDSFGSVAKRALREAFGEGGSHMRVGRFAIVIVGATECIAANVYAGAMGGYAIPRTSKFWASHVRDRTSQIEHIMPQLSPTHPLYSEIIADIHEELAAYA
jgi:hypothetical protein